MNDQTPGPASGFKRRFYLVSGIFLSVLGLAGIFTPLLPTTCFVLGAAWCFSRSSPRLQSWLESNRLLGPYLRAYTRKEGLTAPRSLFLGLFLWAGIGLTIGLTGFPVWLDFLLAGIALAVSVHLVLLTRQGRQNQNGEGVPLP